MLFETLKSSQFPKDPLTIRKQNIPFTMEKVFKLSKLQFCLLHVLAAGRHLCFDLKTLSQLGKLFIIQCRGHFILSRWLIELVFVDSGDT